MGGEGEEEEEADKAALCGAASGGGRGEGGGVGKGPAGARQGGPGWLPLIPWTPERGARGSSLGCGKKIFFVLLTNK